MSDVFGIDVMVSSIHSKRLGCGIYNLRCSIGVFILRLRAPLAHFPQIKPINNSLRIGYLEYQKNYISHVVFKILNIRSVEHFMSSITVTAFRLKRQ